MAKSFVSAEHSSLWIELRCSSRRFDGFDPGFRHWTQTNWKNTTGFIFKDVKIKFKKISKVLMTRTRPAWGRFWSKKAENSSILSRSGARGTSAEDGHLCGSKDYLEVKKHVSYYKKNWLKESGQMKDWRFLHGVFWTRLWTSEDKPEPAHL